jgi:uncharacterized protein with PQ loop repeat
MTTPKKHRHPWTWYYAKWMYVWIVLGSAWILVQGVTVYVNQDAKGLSLAAFILLMIGNVMWFIFGYFCTEPRNWQIVVSATLGFIMATFVLIGIILYG